MTVPEVETGPWVWSRGKFSVHLNPVEKYIIVEESPNTSPGLICRAKNITNKEEAIKLAKKMLEESKK